MPDNQTSYPAINIVRYVLGVGSAVSSAITLLAVISIYPNLLANLRNPIFGEIEKCRALCWYTSIPLGYFLVALFCLRRWPAMAQQEGVRSCRTVLITVLTVGAVGTLFEAVRAGFDAQRVLAAGGVFMLWGYLLASCIRKLRRMRQEANAE